ncbi:YqaJ viral recombinase family protein [Corynebacterium sp.]|uniref:YqaJ viral recombinase family protein n=1 Tax=Corynebacterium sp. TaxID=1720 RepID=UPI0025BF4545|nr:YqaJ viral recombinase family protein [Corynebacterium sp.]
MGFIILPNTGETEWLQQRQKVVTATDMAKIRSGSDAAFMSLWREKHNPPRKFHNKWTEHGKKREPVIAAAITANRPELLPNKSLAVNEDEPRFGATPDMMTADGLMVGEIKTHLIHDESDAWVDWSDVRKDKPQYVVQVQWQLAVTGAAECLFSWEDWSDEDGWADLRPVRHCMVRRDEELIAELQAVALRFLDWTPPDLRTGDSADFETQAAAQLLGEAEAEAARLRAELRRADEMVKAARADLLALVGVSPSRTEFPNAVVEVAPGRRTNSFDRRGLAADYPELDEKYTIKKDGAPSVKVTLKEDE